MALCDIYTEWLTSIDLTRTRIKRFPSFVFLCGGEVGKDSGKYLSCRHIFHDYIRASSLPFKDNIILAETAYRYFYHSTYANLFDFEQDLAHLSALTVIFSESAGSIAELGSFSVMKSLQKKLLVVLHGEDSDKESFIWQGLLTNLRDQAKGWNSPDPVTVYDWRKKSSPGDILTNSDFIYSDDLATDISHHINSLPKTSAFSKTETGHIMLLIIGLLQVVTIAKQNELSEMLSTLNVSLGATHLARYLSLMKTLDLVNTTSLGHNKFYVAGLHKFWLDFGFSDKATTKDSHRWQAVFWDHYQCQEKTKQRAIQAFIARSSPKGSPAT